jgi:hypothetical protein
MKFLIINDSLYFLFFFSKFSSFKEAEDIKSTDFKDKPGLFVGAIAMAFSVFGFIAFALNEHFANHRQDFPMGQFTSEKVMALGGNSKVLSHALFSQFYISFEVISVFSNFSLFFLSSKYLLIISIITGLSCV